MVYLFIMLSIVCLKAKIRCNVCIFVLSESAPPYFTFIPMEKLVWHDPSFELCEIFRNISLAQNATAL